MRFFLCHKIVYFTAKSFYMNFRLQALMGLLIVASFTACNTPPVQQSAFPKWIAQSNIYEVNVRQYTPEGTFAAFSNHLPRLREMGVDILWFMPITPISVADRKGERGSYYAVADYTAVNPEFGTLDDWKALVKKAQGMGFKVIIDWVANHTGADNRWIKTNPEFFVTDAKGNLQYAFDWSDTRDLDYWNPVLRDSMIHAMKFWVTETGIDGFRCDVAAEVPRMFWEEAIRQLKQVKPDIFMLAEADVAWVHDAGFHASYGWDGFAKMKQVAKGEKSARVLDTVLRHLDETFKPGAIKMYFTSNHDENSWNKADYETMPGPIHAPFAVLTQTWKNTLPLIYSGQEEPHLDSLSFFYKDTIHFSKFERAPFYKTLLELRKANPALAVDADYKKLRTTNDDAIYAYLRSKGNSKVLVILNLSGAQQQFQLLDAAAAGTYNNVFRTAKETITNGAAMQLQPWEYFVCEVR
jgi:glycosidase